MTRSDLQNRQLLFELRLIFFGFSRLFSFFSISRAIFLSLVFFLSSQSSPASESIAKAPFPEWYDLAPDVEVNAARLGQAKNGVYRLINDKFLRYRQNGKITITREVSKVTDVPGLEVLGKIEIDFDPDIEKIYLNRIHVVRSGNIIDHTDSAEFIIFSKESDSDSNIYRGLLLGTFQIPDLKVGDIVDYAFTRDTENYSIDNFLYRRFATRWFVPIGLLRTTIAWPEEVKPAISMTSSAPDPAITSDDGLSVYRWQTTDPEPDTEEEYVPSTYQEGDIVTFSTAPSWAAVASALAPLYEPDPSLPSAFAEKIDAIAKRFATPDRRMVAATRLVQDETRYVSLSFGEGGFTPRSPAAIVGSGYGDCKDKSLLLASSLVRLGIDAVVALTSFGDSEWLADDLPGLAVFNHAIVRARIGTETFWLDPTSSMQGGEAGRLVQTHHGYALPILAESATLEKVPRIYLDRPSIVTVESFAMPSVKSASLSLTVESTYQDKAAEQLRWELSTKQAHRMQTKYLEYYSDYYSGIKINEPIYFTDDREKNTIIAHESYVIDEKTLETTGILSKFPLHADLTISKLPAPSAAGRVRPVDLGEPVDRLHTIKVTGLKAKFIGPEGESIHSPHFDLDITSDSIWGAMTISWHLKTGNRTVEPDALPAYLAARTKAAEATFWTYDFSIVDVPRVGTDDGRAIAARNALLLLKLAIIAILVGAFRWFKRRNTNTENH